MSGPGGRNQVREDPQGPTERVHECSLRRRPVKDDTPTETVSEDEETKKVESGIIGEDGPRHPKTVHGTNHETPGGLRPAVTSRDIVLPYPRRRRRPRVPIYYDCDPDPGGNGT